LASDPKYLGKHKLSPETITAVIGLSTPLDLEPRETHTGAALGWYEVTITGLLESVSEPAGGDPKADRLRKELGLKRRTTPYRIKVVEHPVSGHYDNKLETYLGRGIPSLGPAP
jgi:hypothetical protein